MPGAAGQLLEELAELSERTGYICRGGRRPTDLYSKLGVGQRMQHTVVTPAPASSLYSVFAEK